MGSQAKVHESAIHAHIVSFWSSNIAIAWPNVEFTPPAPNDTNPEWLQVEILWGEGFQNTMIDSNYTVGVLQLDIYGPKGVGLGDLLTLANTARDGVDRVTLSRVGIQTNGLVFGTAGGPEKVPDDTYARLMIRTPFYVIETT